MISSLSPQCRADGWKDIVPTIPWWWEGERGGSVVECRTPEREVRGSRPTAAVLCPWARHFTPRKYWLITQEAMAPSRYDWKIVDWDVKPQHNQPNPWWWGVVITNDWCIFEKRLMFKQHSQKCGGWILQQNCQGMRRCALCKVIFSCFLSTKNWPSRLILFSTWCRKLTSNIWTFLSPTCQHRYTYDNQIIGEWQTISLTSWN